MCMNSVALASWDRLSTTALHCLEGRVVDVMDREVSWIQSVEGIFTDQVKCEIDYKSETRTTNFRNFVYICDTFDTRTT